MGAVRQFLDGQFRDLLQGDIGIGGFTAFARVSERLRRTSNVPTTFLEDGTFVTDHIIRDPLILVIEGNVSDIYLPPSAINRTVAEAQEILGVISQYLPERTAAQAEVVSSLLNSVVDQIDRIDSAVESGLQMVGLLGLTGGAAFNNSETFLSQMEAHYYGDYLISIDMPYRRYENMRITSLEIERDNQENALSFRIEATQLRFAETIFSTVAIAPAPSEGLDGQTENVSDKSVQSGETVPPSFLIELSDFLAEKYVEWRG